MRIGSERKAAQLCEMLRIQLDTMLKQSDQATIERAETINRLTKKLNELQKQYDDLICMRSVTETSSNSHKLYETINYLENAKQEREQLCQQLQEKNNDLEEQVRLYEAMQLCSSSSSTGGSSSTSSSSSSSSSSNPINCRDSIDLNESGISSTSNQHSTTTATSNEQLKKELERALNLIKSKRIEIQKYQQEIQKLKQEAKDTKLLQLPPQTTSCSQ